MAAKQGPMRRGTRKWGSPRSGWAKEKKGRGLKRFLAISRTTERRVRASLCHRGKNFMKQGEARRGIGYSPSISKQESPKRKNRRR